MFNVTMDLNEGVFAALTSTSQNLNAASKTDMVLLSTQAQALPLLPMRIPGLGKEYILHVAPDFDESVELTDMHG
jgi:hypothetical protein